MTPTKRLIIDEISAAISASIKKVNNLLNQTTDPPRKIEIIDLFKNQVKNKINEKLEELFDILENTGKDSKNA